MRRLPLRVAGAVAALLCCVPAAQAADGDLSIGHVEPGDDNTIQVLVSVPEGSTVNPDDVTVSIGDTVLDSSAELAGSTDEQVRRTTIIAFDTSNSMGTQGRIDAAKAAAKTFLDTVPDDVYVGIVTFDADVETPLAPTQDRAEAQAVIDDLALATSTRLNDGVIEAVNQAGTDGQRRHPRALRRTGHQHDARVEGHRRHHQGRGRRRRRRPGPERRRPWPRSRRCPTPAAVR